MSFALIGIIIGFFLHAFTLPSQAASASPSLIAQGNTIRPPDPNAAPQGGGCGGGSKQGNGCGGAATGGGCGGGATGGGCGGGAQGVGCGAPRPSPLPSNT
ncbi:hypothetical protein HY285_04135 [Candidatus Peregrinibacteria bacterium]|nr:hypothetical protein [Candidatus Peregrinibacteria bacterium]MBI3816702.1 hypothetical protein [Candidatus Peregrinibacteria bacterium]